MPIIDTSKNQRAKFKGILTFALLLLVFLPGCTRYSDEGRAQIYAARSEEYYLKAINFYQRIIAKGKGLSNAHLELGELYFSHGDYAKAVNELQQSQELLAKKYLGIAYYRLGNFTDAAEIFSKNEIPDDEYLYYHALTCEKLNLFDQAIAIYKQIAAGSFLALAQGRLDAIQKTKSTLNLKDIDPKIWEVITNAPPQEKYPDAGALILLCDEEIKITPENTQTSSLHYVVKILNQRGKENFSETQIDYDSTYERVELEYARTISPDGRVTEVGSRHIRDVSKYLNFPLYSNARVYIISFPEVSEGAVIEYKLKVYCRQLINQRDFIVGYPLQASEPIISASFKVSLPSGRKLYLKNLNQAYNDFAANLLPEIKDNGVLTFSWQFKDIPQIIPEPSMPPSVEVNPAVLISTFNSWQEIYQWWWGLAQDKIKADEAIRLKVVELTRAADTDEAKMRAVYNFCAQKIRYVAVEYGQAGHEPHPAADIFKNKYGDCKDQAILLVTMLKELGLKAWPVLIPTKDTYNLNPEFPAIFFNHCIAVAELNGELIFLDPTAETCAFGDLPSQDQGRRVLVIKESGFEIKETLLYPAQHNRVKQYVDIKINPDETLIAAKRIQTFGAYDQGQRFWLTYTPPQLIKESLEERLQELSIGGKLKSYQIKNLGDLNQPITLSYNFSGPEYLTFAGIARIVPQLVSLDTSLVAKAERRYPLKFDLLDTKEMILGLGLPRNFVIKYLPQDIVISSPWLEFKTEYRRKNNRVIFKQKTQWKKLFISQEEYPAFKEFFENLSKRLKQRIILERAN